MNSFPTSAGPQQLVFMYWPAGMGQPPGAHTPYEVALMNLDGSNLKVLTNDGKTKFLPHFSPNGQKIAYTKFTAGGYGTSDALTEVAVFDLRTNTEILITTGGYNGYPTWSPDGTRLAYLKNARLGSATAPISLVTINVDGSNPVTVGTSPMTASDWGWYDILWSKDNWILFGVGMQNAGTFCKSRLDKVRPDGTSRTQVTDGGPTCTPPGYEGVGDADPGWSSDGRTIYSSRGVSTLPAGAPAGFTSNARKLIAFSSDAWVPGKVETDLSLPSQPDCIDGVPKGSPDGNRILEFRMCFESGVPVPGIFVTDKSGSYRTLVTKGFGPDWNPVATP